MTGVSLASWLGVTLAVDDRAHPETLYGMLGPLVSAGATWVAVERTFRSDPGRLTSVLVTGLALKMLFFGLYVAVMLRVVMVRPVPFVAAFTSYFIALYAMEALFLRRLLLAAPREPRR